MILHCGQGQWASGLTASSEGMTREAIEASTAGIWSRPYWAAPLMAAKALQALGRWTSALASSQYLWSSSKYGAEGGTLNEDSFGARLKNVLEGATSAGAAFKPCRQTASCIACLTVKGPVSASCKESSPEPRESDADGRELPSETTCDSVAAVHDRVGPPGIRFRRRALSWANSKASVSTLLAKGSALLHLLFALGLFTRAWLRRLRGGLRTGNPGGGGAVIVRLPSYLTKRAVLYNNSMPAQLTDRACLRCPTPRHLGHLSWPSSGVRGAMQEAQAGNIAAVVEHSRVWTLKCNTARTNRGTTGVEEPPARNVSKRSLQALQTQGEKGTSATSKRV